MVTALKFFLGQDEEEDNDSDDSDDEDEQVRVTRAEHVTCHSF